MDCRHGNSITTQGSKYRNKERKHVFINLFNLNVYVLVEWNNLCIVSWYLYKDILLSNELPKYQTSYFMSDMNTSISAAV